MNDSTVRIRRSELYEQVWTVSITKLSKKYGLSDVGLAKICKKYNIPRPPRGYWAIKAAGYKAKQLPLPSREDVVIDISPNPHSLKANKNRELVAKISPPAVEEEVIVVPDRLSNPHPLIQQTSEILNGQQPNDVGTLNPPKDRCLDVSVSKGSLRRALRIMDTIIKVLEKQGHEVYLFKNRTRTKIQNVSISFGISEKLAVRKRRPEEHELSGRYQFGYSRFIEERVPSGDLCLTIHDAEDFYIYGCQQNWNDGKKSKIENRISSFIEGLVSVAAAKIAQDKEREEEERRRIERKRQIEQERMKRADLRRRYLEEEARVNRLIEDAENWKRSQLLREYIAEIKRLASACDPTIRTEQPLEEWLKWAQDQAERLDPLAPSPASILDEECPEEEKENESPYSRWSS
jgi:hypothetical protein